MSENDETVQRVALALVSAWPASWIWIDGEAEIGARAAIAAMPEPWRPIESAPKNQIIDLLFRGNLRIVDCIWYLEGWWSTEQGDPMVCVSGLSKPTHWMPLPSPPEV